MPNFPVENVGKSVEIIKTKRILVGLVHHTDRERVESQAKEANILITYLRTAGFAVQEQVAFHQSPLKSFEKMGARDYLNIVQTNWRQEVFSAKEFRRRKGIPTRLSMRKRLRITIRLVTLLCDPIASKRAAIRREIEAALSLKHFHLWSCLANSNFSGAVIVEDDFLLRRDTGLDSLGNLLNRYAESVDYIDLAGGFSRAQLGLACQDGGDLVLDYLFSNTTCGYFISRRAAKGLIDLMNSGNFLRYLGADFIIGTLNDAGFVGKTVLPGCLPFVHGSLEGLTESSIPY